MVSSIIRQSLLVCLAADADLGLCRPMPWTQAALVYLRCYNALAAPSPNPSFLPILELYKQSQVSTSAKMTESIVMQTAVTISAFSLYSFLVFTPEPLVLLRDLIFVASLTGGTLCLYKYWEESSLKPIVAAFQSGGLSAMRTLFLKMALSRGVEYGFKLRDSVWQKTASFVGLLSSLATPTRWFKTYNPFTPTSQSKSQVAIAIHLTSMTNILWALFQMIQLMPLIPNNSTLYW